MFPTCISFLLKHPSFLLSLFSKQSPAGTHHELSNPYLWAYSGTALPTLTELGTLISAAWVLACLALPVPACSTFLHY